MKLSKAQKQVIREMRKGQSFATRVGQKSFKLSTDVRGYPQSVNKSTADALIKLELIEFKNMVGVGIIYQLTKLGKEIEL